MTADGYTPIDDPSISAEVRDMVRAQVLNQLDGYFELNQPPNIKWTMSALQRKLYAFTARTAEEGWRFFKEVRTHPEAVRIEIRYDRVDSIKIRHGRNPTKWFLVHDPSGAIAYMQMADDAGRTAFERPQNVKDEDLIEIWVPKESPTVLRDFLHKLEAQLDPHNPDDIPFIEAQQKRQPGLAVMYSANRDELNGVLFVDLYREILFRKSDFPFESCLSKMQSDHANFLADGDFCGQLCLLISALRLAIASGKLSKIDEAISPAAGSFYEILQRIGATADGREFIREASDSMQARGEQLQLSALDADSVGRFYGDIFLSCFWLWGAYKGFRYLSQTSSPSLDPAIKISANVCDERLAHASTSLTTGFLDTFSGRALMVTRDLITRERRISGDDAAEALADHYIEAMLEYPRYFRQVLLSEQNRYPVRNV